VYIREAHAADSSWPMPVPDRKINTAKSILDRRKVATTCVIDLGIKIPCLVDDMENSTDGKYHGWPDRLFVVDKEGKIALAGGQGPWGFKPNEVRTWLEKTFPDVKTEQEKNKTGNTTKD